jgi:hypothetical protein
MAAKWINRMHLQKGKLHSDLNVPAGMKVPKAKIASAAKMGGKIGMRARLAQTFAKMRDK